MVHGQLPRRKFPAAVMAYPAASLRFHHWLARSSRAFCRSRRISASLTSTRKGTDSIQRAKWAICTADPILEIEAEAYGNQPVERGAQHCPSLTGIGIIPQFPQPKKEKKDCGSGDQNLVCVSNLISKLPML